MSLSDERPFRMYGSGQKTLPDVRERFGGPPVYLGVVESASRMSRS